MKYTLNFKTQEELVQYFGGLDKVPSKCLALIDEVPYTTPSSETVAPATVSDVLISSTNNYSNTNTVRPTGVSAVETVIEAGEAIEENDDATYWSNMICFGQDPAPTSTAEIEEENNEEINPR